MKILFVFEHFHPYIGGAEELFLGLASTLSRKGNEVTVVTTLHDRSLPKTELYNGITIHRINCHNRFLFTFLSLPTIISLARNADFIHTASYNAAVPAFIAGKLCRKKVFITFHEVWGMLWLKLPFKSKLLLYAYYCYEKFILKLPFDKYVAVSEFTFNALKNAGVKVNKIRRIYNGLDYSKFNEYKFSPPTTFTFCYFGRLGISKGLDTLLYAFQQFYSAHAEVKLKLIIPTYPDDLYKKVMKIISDTGIRNNISLFHDLTKQQLFNEITSSSCVVIPSLSEGFCYTAAEATALKIPVISSGKGALREVTGGKHIHLKELTAEDLLLAMKRAYSGAWEYSEPKKFQLNESTDSYLELYNEYQGSIT